AVDQPQGVVQAPVMSQQVFQQHMLAAVAQLTNRLQTVENNQQPQPLQLPHAPPQQPPLQIGNGWQQPPQPQVSAAGAQAAAQRTAAEQAGIKANAKRAVDSWRATTGPMFFLLRGGFDVSEDLTFH
ncbi:unnamed protein product, partial [Sphacelaria rigidula]